MQKIWTRLLDVWKIRKRIFCCCLSFTSKAQYNFCSIFSLHIPDAYDYASHQTGMFFLQGETQLVVCENFQSTIRNKYNLQNIQFVLVEK